jgi:hypothetical protein
VGGRADGGLGEEVGRERVRVERMEGRARAGRNGSAHGKGQLATLANAVTGAVAGAVAGAVSALR